MYKPGPLIDTLELRHNIIVLRNVLLMSVLMSGGLPKYVSWAGVSLKYVSWAGVSLNTDSTDSTAAVT